MKKLHLKFWPFGGYHKSTFLIPIIIILTESNILFIVLTRWPVFDEFKISLFKTRDCLVSSRGINSLGGLSLLEDKNPFIPINRSKDN